MTNRGASANLSALFALVLAVPLALGIVIAWAPLRDTFPAPEPEPQVPLAPRPKAPPKAKPKDKAKEEPKKPVAGAAPKVRPPVPSSPSVLALVLALGVAAGLEDDLDDATTAPPPREFVPHALRKPLALAGCRRIFAAIEAYTDSDRNPGLTDEERFPRTERDLFEPPFGGPSFLPHGRADLIDPWGRPYQFRFLARADGTRAAEVYTHAPDGEYIDHTGIGLP
jgi:hypothetical protein